MATWPVLVAGASIEKALSDVMSILRPDGLLVLDKPGGLTSRDAVNRAQAWFPRRTRLGHTGTLDPLATGVLVLCIGQATRLAEYVQAMEKTYHTIFRLGERSSTDDAEGDIQASAGAQVPDEPLIRERLHEFLGEIDQVPPAFSAAKITGRRAYEVARAGGDVSLSRRRVKIYEIRLLTYAYPRLELEVRCGKGTYIRSLARDLGERLGCGALVETLRRLRVGPFTVDSAVSLDADAATVKESMLPMEAAVAQLPNYTLANADLERLRHGQAVALGLAVSCLAPATEIAVLDARGRLAAVARVTSDGLSLQPEKVLAAPAAQ